MIPIELFLLGFEDFARYSIENLFPIQNKGSTIIIYEINKAIPIHLVLTLLNIIIIQPK